MNELRQLSELLHKFQTMVEMAFTKEIERDGITRTLLDNRRMQRLETDVVLQRVMAWIDHPKSGAQKEAMKEINQLKEPGQ